MTESNNRTSILVSSHVPAFVKEDHNIFVQFLESYYKFLEDSSYKKAVISNLTASTKIGPSGVYQNTDTVILSDRACLSNVAIANGAKINIDGTVTYAYDVLIDSNEIKVDPPVPTRIVQGDLYVYTTQALNTNNQLMNITKNWSRYQDIDVATTDNETVRQKLYDNFIGVLPQNLLADKTLIAKHAKEFYRAKGSENSVKFLLRALYGAESTFYYPKQDILRGSDGKWHVEKSIRVKDSKVDTVPNTAIYSNFVGKKITGNTSLAQAIVEGINVYYKNGQLITELLISNSNIPFLANEEVIAYFQDTPTSNPKRISARIFGGQIVDTQIIEGGTGYLEGMLVPVIPTDNTGNGAKIQISKVSRGGINRIYVGTGDVLNYPEFGGVGYLVDDLILITGGGGTGALGGIESVWDNNYYHPNTYSLAITTIADVAGYTALTLGNAAPNLNISSTTTIANSVVGDSLQYYTYGPTGPVKFCYVVNEGQFYGGATDPEFKVQADPIIQSLGILGKMVINDGGRNYVVGDTIQFVNRSDYSYGSGATANVTNVNANGTITEVHFRAMPGHLIGGSGYNQKYLPTCNVVTSTGNGANIVVTNILGTGGTFSFTTESLGIIKAIKILDGGSAYNKQPILDLTKLGDGKAQVVAKSITGVYSYPGRYLNEDGFLSSKNKLEDRDYYQNFSYVIRSKAPINRYRPILKSMTHPAGTQMFGVYETIDQSNAYEQTTYSYKTANTVTVSIDGLAVYLDTANTIDPWTGEGYEYNIYDSRFYGDFHIFTANAENIVNQAISTDGTAYNHPTTWVNLANMNDIGAILNGASINQETGILRFDGTNEYATFNVNEELNSQSLTIDAWFAPENLYETGFIFEKGFKNDQYGLLMQYNSKIRDSELIWRLKLNGDIIDVIKVPVHQFLKRGWNHVTLTQTFGRQKMYINGEYITSNVAIGIMPSSPAGLTVGCSGKTSGTDSSRTYHYEGAVGIVRIYNRELDSVEIYKNYNRDRGRYGQ